MIHTTPYIASNVSEANNVTPQPPATYLPERQDAVHASTPVLTQPAPAKHGGVMEHKLRGYPAQEKSGASIKRKLELLISSILHGRKESVALLAGTMSVAELDTQDENDMTALMHAAENGKTEIVDILLKCKASTAPVNASGQNAMILAVQQEHVETVRSLLLAMDAHEIDQQGEDGWTALMEATGIGSLDIVKLLKTHKASTDIVNEDEMDALAIALELWNPRGDALFETGSDEEQAMLIALELIKLDPEHKFKFEYRGADITERLAEEDRYALKAICSDSAKQATQTVASMVANYLENDANLHSGREKLISSLNENLRSCRGEYPMLKKDFENFSELLAFLRGEDSGQDENRHIKQLSVLWLLPKFMAKSRIQAEHDAIYRGMLRPEKKNIYADSPVPQPSTQFGNSRTVHSPIFADGDFAPFSRSVDYISVDPKTTAPRIRKFLQKNKPYISGMSGMANMTGALLDRLGIGPMDKTGKPFCDAMAAFIVGSGMHSYPEVYKSFNACLKLLEARNLT
jgi:hypothetical protein